MTRSTLERVQVACETLDHSTEAPDEGIYILAKMSSIAFCVGII